MVSAANTGSGPSRVRSTGLRDDPTDHLVAGRYHIATSPPPCRHPDLFDTGQNLQHNSDHTELRRTRIMNHAQLHPLGVHIAVNGLALSLRAAKSYEQQQAVRQRELERKAQQQQRRALRGSKDIYTTAV